MPFAPDSLVRFFFFVLFFYTWFCFFSICLKPFFVYFNLTSACVLIVCSPDTLLIIESSQSQQAMRQCANATRQEKLKIFPELIKRRGLRRAQ